MMKNAYIHCLNLTSVWRQQRRRRRRPACAHGRVVAVVEETGSSGVDGGRRARRSRERRGFREFWDEKRNGMGRATIYRIENISSGSGLKSLLIVLEYRPKWFWFTTTADEGIISSGSKLEPLLIT
jgi:hypothetical protein